MLAGIRRSRVTIAVVVCTFTAASVAAYQVYNAVCAQESAAQRALLSHARFAAWTFTREANVELERAASLTRNARAGTILGSGTISNYDRSLGSACIAERRTLEQLEQGKPVTPFMKFGDRIRIEMLDRKGTSILGAIDQKVVKYTPPT